MTLTCIAFEAHSNTLLLYFVSKCFERKEGKCFFFQTYAGKENANKAIAVIYTSIRKFGYLLRYHVRTAEQILTKFSTGVDFI